MCVFVCVCVCVWVCVLFFGVGGYLTKFGFFGDNFGFLRLNKWKNKCFELILVLVSFTTDHGRQFYTLFTYPSCLVSKISQFFLFGCHMSKTIILDSLIFKKWNAWNNILHLRYEWPMFTTRSKGHRLRHVYHLVCHYLFQPVTTEPRKHKHFGTKIPKYQNKASFSIFDGFLLF